MSELMRRIESASAQVQVGWSDERAKSVERSMLNRKTRRARQKAGFAVVTTVAAAAALFLLVGRHRLEREASCVLNPMRITSPSLVLPDGSRAFSQSEQLVLSAAESTPDRVVMRLDSGSARFDVVPNPSRIFEVDAGDIAIRVLGTSFLVEKTVVGARVSVTKGRVRVSWSGESVELGAGESGDFPQAKTKPEESNAKLLDPEPKAKPHASAIVPVTSTPNWRDLARDGNYEKAYELWHADGNQDDARDLMLAADVARLSRHAGEAIAPLNAVTRRHRGDPRAPLAAFTLGRILLDDLGRPSEAAQAFAEARQMAPSGAMAEDALAREVESWSRAGDLGRARSSAESYLRAYPQGRRTNSVKKFGGIE